jgi:hypothetical protein
MLKMLKLLNGAMISPDFGQSLKAFRNRFIAKFSNALLKMFFMLNDKA